MMPYSDPTRQQNWKRQWARSHPEVAQTARESRRRRGLAPRDPRHGTDNGYTNWFCRCEPCREAHAASSSAYRQAHGDKVRATERRYASAQTQTDREVFREATTPSRCLSNGESDE